MAEKENDTSNHQLVGAAGSDVVVMMPKNRMPKSEALLHAAWLVALADDNNEFPKILETVNNT